MFRKFVVIFTVLLLAGGLFAQGGEKPLEDALKFKAGGMLYIYNTRQRTVDGGDPLAYWETRYRQYLSVGNKMIEAMLKLEIDPTWGSGPGSNNVNLEADMKGELQVKNAYLRFTMPDMPLTVKAGVLFHMSPGMLMFANDFGGITLNYKAGGVKIDAIYGKLSEGFNDFADDDAAIYGVSASFGSKEMKITPAVYYIYKGADVTNTGAIPAANVTNQNYHGVLTRNAFVPQINLKMKAGNLDLCATLAYGLGKIKDAFTADASGLGLDIKFNYKINKNVKVGFVGNYLSGDDAGTSDFESFAQFMPGYVAGGNIERGVRLTAASLFLQGGLTAHPAENIGKFDVYNHGLILAGVNFCLASGRLSLKATAVYLSAAQEHSGGSKSYGIEADFFVEYEIYKNLKLQAEASFFKPSSDYQGSLPDLCSFYAVGTSFKW